MQALSIHLNGPQDTVNLAAALESCIEGRALIGLVGNLGAGKTTFTKGLAERLGVEETVSSPSFLMLNEYHSGRLSLYHFDLYRMQEDLSASTAAISSLKSELDEIMNGKEPCVVVVEWINLFEDFSIDYDELRIDFAYTEAETDRIVTLRARGASAEKLLLCCQAKLQCSNAD